MPFQVSYSQRQRLFSQVTLITAGEDQIHICTPTIYLVGEVAGDMTGHTIEWEQIQGTSVTLINGATLTPHFDAVDGTDKRFRLWIDRGTPFEQYDDVAILKTPTSFADCGFINTQSTVGGELDPREVDCVNITEFVNVIVNPPTSLSGEDPLGATIVVEVSWAHPTVNTRFLPYIEQYKVVENTLVVDSLPDVPIPDAGDGTGPPSETLQYAGTFAEYRIDTYYNISGKKFVKESCTKDYSTLPQPLILIYNDNVPGVGFKAEQSTVTKTYYTNIFISDEDVTSTAFNKDEAYLDKVLYTFISNSEGQDPALTSFSPTTLNINITRYGGSGIGGG